MLKIGINCLEFTKEEVGGVYSYTFGLLNAFHENKELNHTFCLFIRPEARNLFSSFTDDARFQFFSVPGSLNKRRILWFLSQHGNAGLYRRVRNFLYQKETDLMNAHADIIYTPTTLLFSYNGKKPSVLSMHDIQHDHYPEFFSAQELRWRQIVYPLSARYATVLQASSEYIRDDFRSHFHNLSASSISIIPEGVDIAFFQKQRKQEDLLTKYGLPANFLLYPAQLWLHKNHLLLLKALLLLKEEGVTIPLVLTGAKYGAGQPVLDFISSHSLNTVFHLGKIPFDDLAGLYQKARFLVMPSLHESNSLPILEAAAAGTPILASDIAPNMELGKCLALNIFDRNNPASLAALIRKVWDDTRLRNVQREHNLQNIPLYSWHNTAEQYIRLFESAARH